MYCNEGNELDNDHWAYMVGIWRDEPGMFLEARYLSAELINHRDTRNPPHRTLLQEAIHHGCSEIFHLLMKNNTLNVNVADDNGYTALHYAVSKKDLNLIKQLVSLEADLNLRDNEGLSPLMLAWKDNENAICLYLLGSGADISLDYFEGENGPQEFYEFFDDLNLHIDTWVCKDNIDKPKILHLLMRDPQYMELARMAFELGAYADVTDWQDQTPMHYASAHNNIEGIHLLMKHGAEVNKLSHLWISPLWCAVDNEYPDTVACLLKDYQAKPITNKDFSAPAMSRLHHTLLDLFPDMPEARESAKALYTRPCLHTACMLGSYSIIKMLLNYGAGVAELNDQGHTPLFISADNGDITLTELLLNNKANVNWQAKDGATALHYSASAGKAALSKLLLQHNADINKKNHQGNTPLHYATQSGAFELVQLLLDNGADIDAQNAAGLTPLHVACTQFSRESIQTVTVLLAGGADIHIIDNQKRSAREIAHKQSSFNVYFLLATQEKLDAQQQQAKANIANDVARSPVRKRKVLSKSNNNNNNLSSPPFKLFESSNNNPLLFTTQLNSSRLIKPEKEEISSKCFIL